MRAGVASGEILAEVVEQYLAPAARGLAEAQERGEFEVLDAAPFVARVVGS